MFFVVSLALIFGGVYLSLSTTPKSILIEAVNGFYNKTEEFMAKDESLKYRDNFTIDSKIKINSKIDPETKVINNKDLFTNLAKLDTNIKFSQSLDTKKTLLSVNSKKDNNDYVNIKYLVKDSTGYYYNSKIINKYVNVGTNNYFENLGKDVSNKDNLSYINTFLINSIINNIEEDDIDTSKENIDINNSKVNANLISVELDNSKLNKIYKKVIKDLKKDKKASTIINNYYYDFNNYKPEGNYKFLKKNETIIFKLYTKGLTNQFVKFEVIDKNNNEEDKINYEKIDDNNSVLYLIEDSKLKYELDIKKDNENKYDVKIKDNYSNDIGTITITKTNKEKIIDLSIVDEDKRLDVDYNLKFKDVTNKSYNEIVSLDITYLEKNKNIFSLSFNMNNEITRSSEIKEDTSNSILEKSLTPEQVTKKDNYFKDLIDDLVGGNNG